MKTLVVYYSRSNITKEIAKEIQNELNCDIEEIKPLKDYDGKTGYAKAGYESMTKKTPKIEDAQHNPADYDLVIVGTPVWSSNMATPIFHQAQHNLSEKKTQQALQPLLFLDTLSRNGH